MDLVRFNEHRRYCLKQIGNQIARIIIILITIMIGPLLHLRFDISSRLVILESCCCKRSFIWNTILNLMSPLFCTKWMIAQINNRE
jgi:hypothetical protein